MNRLTRDSRLLPWLLAPLLFAACFWLDTRDNAFPFFYHGDEPGKVAQILTGEWNFHHPTLMLGMVQLATDALHTPLDQQQIVMVGRAVSAAFAALGVTALTLLAFYRRGPAGFLAVAVALALHHQIFELAHYMKEDTALLMGLALAFLALAFFENHPTKLRAILLGAACGLSVSAKYVGLAMLIPALVVLARAPRPEPVKSRRRAASFALFFLGFALACAMANAPMLAHFQTFRSSFDRELTLVTQGKEDVTRHVPHSEYFKAFVNNTNPVIWLLLGFYFVCFWKARRGRSLTEWSLAIFPIAFAIMLSFSPKANDRYFLPCTALLAVLAGLGACDAAACWHQRTRLSGRSAFCVIVGVLAIFQTVRFRPVNRHSLLEYYTAFARDDRKDLIAWMSDSRNIPPQAVVAQDDWVSLPIPDYPERQKVLPTVPQKILGGRQPLAEDPNLNSLEKLRQQGVAYVVISENDYGRYRLASLQPRNGKQTEFLRKRNFYDGLLHSGPALWQRDRSAVIYLHPGLQVYALPP